MSGEQVRPPTPSMRLLYLDFDGVLHPADVWLGSDGRMRLGQGGDGHALFEHAQCLADLLAPHDDVMVVLSTSWVSGLGFDQALAQLPAALSQKVIGATFDPARHGKGFGDVARGYQVQADALRRQLRDWVALDDDARDWPEEDIERLIRTDPMLGLNTLTTLSRLRSWLARKPP